MNAPHIQTDRAPTQRELLEAFRRGERITAHSLFTEEKDIECAHYHHRTLVCATDADGHERDVVECDRCGQQKETSCNFDEEYS